MKTGEAPGADDHPQDLDALAGQLAGAREPTNQNVALQPEEDAPRAIPQDRAEAFANKTAGTLDEAGASILERVRAVRDRCDMIERAVTDDIQNTKRQIFATLALAQSADRLTQRIDRELDEIIAERQRMAATISGKQS